MFQTNVVALNKIHILCPILFSIAIFTIIFIICASKYVNMGSSEEIGEFAYSQLHPKAIYFISISIFRVIQYVQGIRRQTSKIIFFYQRAIKWTLLPRAGQTNPLSDPIVEKKSCATREKHLFYSCGCYPRFARASNFTLAK